MNTTEKAFVFQPTGSIYDLEDFEDLNSLIDFLDNMFCTHIVHDTTMQQENRRDDAVFNYRMIRHTLANLKPLNTSLCK